MGNVCCSCLNYSEGTILQEKIFLKIATEESSKKIVLCMHVDSIEDKFET